jgi:hypothetical protein
VHGLLPRRAAAVAGRFYPGSGAKLAATTQALLGEVHARSARAVIVPHAGWSYSGAIAGAVYAQVRVPDVVVVLGPNHTGLGRRRSLWSGGPWRLPDADVEVDGATVAALAASGDFEPDLDAHLREHSIEVQLPFLRARNPAFRVVPIILAHLDFLECQRLGQTLAKVLSATGPGALVVASSDMSHYIPAAEAARLDRLALERALALDPEGLYHTVVSENISMCGFVPATVALVAALAAGARAAELVRYGHSGETSGDHDRVVGYAGVAIR